ncbi:hypothetical protein ACLOJK_002755 [Asimina triloba]
MKSAPASYSFYPSSHYLPPPPSVPLPWPLLQPLITGTPASGLPSPCLQPLFHLPIFPPTSKGTSHRWIAHLQPPIAESPTSSRFLLLLLIFLAPPISRSPFFPHPEPLLILSPNLFSSLTPVGDLLPSSVLIYSDLLLSAAAPIWLLLQSATTPILLLL